MHVSHSMPQLDNAKRLQAQFNLRLSVSFSVFMRVLLKRNSPHIKLVAARVEVAAVWKFAGCLQVFI